MNLGGRPGLIILHLVRRILGDLAANFSSEDFPRIFRPRFSAPPPQRIYAQNRRHSSPIPLFLNPTIFYADSLLAVKTKIFSYPPERKRHININLLAGDPSSEGEVSWLDGQGWKRRKGGGVLLFANRERRGGVSEEGRQGGAHRRWEGVAGRGGGG